MRSDGPCGDQYPVSCNINAHLLFSLIPMVWIHVTLTVRNQSDTETVLSLLQEHARRSRTEPGCFRFDAFQSNLDPHVFFLVEAWQSAEFLETHRQAEAFTTIYAPRVLPLVDRAVHELTPILTPQ